MDQDREYPAAAAAGRALARAEYALWQTVVDEHAAGLAAVDALDDTALGRQIGARAVTLDLAQTLHLSETRLWSIHANAVEVSDRLPALWAAFGRGEVDAYRVQVVAFFLREATTARFVELLDGRAVEYATGHTAAELRTWLRRWRARLEPDATAEAVRRAVERRRVHLFHHDDGTSTLDALLPTPVALAVEHRLRRAVGPLPTHRLDPDGPHPDRPGPGRAGATGDPLVPDTRTVDQRRADLLAHRLTCSDGTETDVRAEIAVTIDAADLYGFTDQPGITRDGQHPLPAAWVRELATSPTTLFRRMVLDPAGRVLDTTSLGYQPPGALREALRWRDGCCRVAGCQAPIDGCDLDHRTPYHRGGPTCARNLDHLCRRHHAIKGHGYLHRRHLRSPPSHRERLGTGPPVLIDLVHHRPPPHDLPPPRAPVAPDPLPGASTDPVVA